MNAVDLDSLVVKALLAVMTVIGGFVVRFLSSLAREILSLNMAITKVVERTEQHERRIGVLEDRP